jgi:hypothetical protein
MNQDLTQKWLAEIQTLKQQIAELQQKRDELWESSEKWRQVYNTESEQRRQDVQIYQKQIASLTAEIHKLQVIHTDTITETTTNDIELELSAITSIDELKAKLIIVTQERDRLIQVLRTEQENHKQTRINLTTALGDVIDSLRQLRAATKSVAEPREDNSANSGQ